MNVEIYSDIVCPWCYIGERRFARALDGYAGKREVDVVFRPYMLDPEAPAEAVPLTEYLTARYGPGVDRMLARAGDAAAAEGVVIDWDRVRTVNTRTAHRLLGLAEREYGADAQRALAGELFALYFQHGGDVSDHASLAAAAAAAGLDPERVRAYLASDEGEHELDAAYAYARRLGIQAVPTFVFEGRFAVQGAQPAEVFRRALEEVAAA